MSFVTFVRDYIQDPDKIIYLPKFVFDGCKEIFWYIFSFQWFRNLTYVTLSFPASNGLHPTGDYNLFDQRFIETYKENITNFLSQSTNQIQNFSVLTNNNSLLNTSFESSLASPEQVPSFYNLLYGLVNGISSCFHFCAVTILVIHVLLNENKTKAFKISLASCFGDISYMIAVLFGFRGLIVPWLILEPLSYVLGFAIQFFFALEIIKDNRRIKASSDRQFDRRTPNKTTPSLGFLQSGQLSFNRWLIPSLISFSWCEQTQFFQTGGVFSLQPTATLLEMPGLISIASQNGSSFGRELQIFIYLFTFIITRIAFTWFCLSISQNLINWKDNNTLQMPSLKSKVSPSATSSSIFNPTKAVFLFTRLPSKLLTPSERQKTFLQIKNNILQTFLYGRNKIKNLFYNIKLWFIPKSLQRQPAGVGSGLTDQPPNNLNQQNKVMGEPLSSAAYSSEGYLSLNKQKGKKIQHLLRDPLAIAAVTCSLAFLPAYSTNLLLTKSAGFFPEENRVKHSLLSPWDMPATVLASDMDFISNHPNLAEYPFFLPFYDKGEYGGWLGVGEEDIRYGPFRLWQSRRIRAPWRRTTLQEPALTFANDKSLFINPLLRTPNLKNNLIQGDADIKGMGVDETANIKKGTFVSPLNNVNTLKSKTSTLGARTAGSSKHGLHHASKAYNKEGGSATTKNTYKRDKDSTVNNDSDDKISKNITSFQKWDYLWKQLKTQSAYTKLLAINNAKPFSMLPPSVAASKSSLIPPAFDFGNVVSSSSSAKQPSLITSSETILPSEDGKMKDFKEAKVRSTSSQIGARRSSQTKTGETALPEANTEGGGFKEKGKIQNATIINPSSDSALDNSTFIAENKNSQSKEITKAQTLKITKGGRKKLIEVLKKPLRKAKTSLFFGSNSIVWSNEYKDSYEPLTGVADTFGTGRESSIDLSQKSTNNKFLNIKNSFSWIHSLLNSKHLVSTNQENQIKNNKQIRKRFKKFKKKSRLFRTRASKKRNTKIKRLKHFHYLRNKSKKRRKSRRLIYKLRRQYPYIRNIKERKAETFGLYSSTYNSSASRFDKASSFEDAATATEGGSGSVEDFNRNKEGDSNFKYTNLKENKENMSSPGLAVRVKPMLMPEASASVSKKMFLDISQTYSPFVQQVLQQPNDTNSQISLQEKIPYLTQYPKNKGSINTKKDFNLIFRTQMGERLDFAQEEIRARIFMNPYVRFLLNNRIDKFISRSDLMNRCWDVQCRDGGDKTDADADSQTEGFKEEVPAGVGYPSINKAPQNKDLSTHGDVTVKPMPLPIPKVSATASVSSDQKPNSLSVNKKIARVRGMLATPPSFLPQTEGFKENDLFKRRLIIEKYVDAVNFLKPSLRHSYADRVYNHQFKGTLSTARRLFSLKIQYDQPLVHTLNYKSVIKHEGLPLSIDKSLVSENNSVRNKIENNGQNLLEQGYSAPLYAVWDPQLRKLILTNRYLDHKTATMKSSLIPPTVISSSSAMNNVVHQDNNLVEFTNWPLKESYFKDNEFLVSQLYSNSQPIDSFLSQENEKARPVALPRRVNSFNTVLNHKNNVQPTNAQRSQQFLKIESNDKKTFLFKHSWNSSKTANELASPFFSKSQMTSYKALENSQEFKDSLKPSVSPDLKFKTSSKGLRPNESKVSKLSANAELKQYIPTSAEQRKTARMDEREYSLWMVLKALPPNQGGFLWPGD